MEERRKKWIVYDVRGVVAGWFEDKDLADAFAEEIGGKVQLVYV